MNIDQMGLTGSDKNKAPLLLPSTGYQVNPDWVTAPLEQHFDPNPMATIYVDPPPWWKRLGLKLYPSRWIDLGDMIPKMGGKGDVIHNEVTVTLSWTARLRVLLSGRLQVNTRIVTEHPIGAMLSKSETYPLPPAWL